MTTVQNTIEDAKLEALAGELLSLATGGGERNLAAIRLRLNETPIIELRDLRYALHRLTEIVDDWGILLTPKRWRKKKRRA